MVALDPQPEVGQANQWSLWIRNQRSGKLTSGRLAAGDEGGNETDDHGDDEDDEDNDENDKLCDNTVFGSQA